MRHVNGMRLLPALALAAASAWAQAPAGGAFVEDLQHRAFLFFWERSDPQTGLALDRAKSAASQAALGPQIALPTLILVQKSRNTTNVLT